MIYNMWESFVEWIPKSVLISVRILYYDICESCLLIFQCKLGSETASMSSISSTDESFHWRQPAPQEAPLQQLEEESDGESKMSGSQLVDSCL